MLHMVHDDIHPIDLQMILYCINHLHLGITNLRVVGVFGDEDISYEVMKHPIANRHVLGGHNQPVRCGAASSFIVNLMLS